MRYGMQLLILGICVGVLLLSGCTTSDTITAAEVKINMLGASGEVTSYQFSMEMTMSSPTMGDDPEEGMSTTMSGVGSVDMTNQKMYMEQSTDMQGTYVSTLIYFVDNVMYTNMPTTGWMKKNMTTTLWNNYDQMDMQVSLLESSEVKKLNDAKVNGVDCYVLELTPDPEQYYNMIMQQQGQDISQLPEGTDFSELMSDWLIKQWIAKDTNYIMKSYYTMTMNFFGMEMTYDTTVEYSNYNDPVTITLPAEAEDAVWIT
jgi:outer membrane lipoprotein-sorting protein